MRTGKLPQLPVGLLEDEGSMTKHAEGRLSERGISRKAVMAALFFGRTIHVRGADICVIGRKEVKRLRREGFDVSGYEGLHVVCSGDGCVLTVYRNYDLRGLRPRRRRRRFQGGRVTQLDSHAVPCWSFDEQPADCEIHVERPTGSEAA